MGTGRRGAGVRISDKMERGHVSSSFDYDVLCGQFEMLYPSLLYDVDN